MNIIVCIKQIPDTNDVKWTKDNNIIRDNLISILNPYDEKAILTALEIKKAVKNSKITLLSMGPNNAVQSLRYGLTLGADEAILLSDKKFSGADTNATSKTLKAAIQNFIKDFDLIITGQFALDGDTSQTPYSLANRLNLEILGYVVEIVSVNEGEITVKQIKDNGSYLTKCSVPCLVSVSDFKKETKKPSVFDYMMGQDKKITILNADDIKIDSKETGIVGSPTYVKKAYRPENNRNCKFVESIFELRGEIFNGWNSFIYWMRRK